MAETFLWREGRVERLEESADLQAASVRLPAGTYTTLRTYGHDGVARLEQHTERLRESARRQGMVDTLQTASVANALTQALDATRLPESRIRLTYAPPDLYVSVEPFEPLPESLYRDGVWCVTVPVRRDDPRVKDTRFLATARGAQEALPAGAHEGLLVAADGSVLEGLSSNVFLVRDGILHTAEDGVLPGVTRAMVLEAARDLLPLATRPLRVDELAEADECFLTSVSREVLPVVKVDAVRIGTGAPGRRTHEIMVRLRDLIGREALHLLGRPRA
jgi:branched-subunit amino acid aminotransferase/4-amino-4-deoxychorismate lyase